MHVIGHDDGQLYGRNVDIKQKLFLFDMTIVETELPY